MSRPHAFLRGRNSAVFAWPLFAGIGDGVGKEACHGAYAVGFKGKCKNAREK
jgi:hypothetical protein